MKVSQKETSSRVSTTASSRKGSSLQRSGSRRGNQLEESYELGGGNKVDGDRPASRGLILGHRASVNYYMEGDEDGPHSAADSFVNDSSHQMGASASLSEPLAPAYETEGGSRRSWDRERERERGIGKVDKFRREFSADHPLAGGRGKYASESSRSSGGESHQPIERVSTLVKDKGKSLQNKPDPYAQLDALRKMQNEVLLRVLEEERLAEAERERMGRLLGSTEVDERRQLELVYAEERRRASERIISLTREHEQRLREAVLSIDASSG